MNLRSLLLAAVATAALSITPAQAAFHLFRIDQIYSNADGSVQYVVIREATGTNGENFWAGNSLRTTNVAGISKNSPFPSNLPSSITASRSVLIATPGFAALNLVTPDFTIPARFIPTDGGTLDYASGTDHISLPPLPTDGATAIDRNGTPVAGAPKNFGNATGTMTAMAVTSVEFYNASLDHYFISALAPDIDALDSGRTLRDQMAAMGWTIEGDGPDFVVMCAPPAPATVNAETTMDVGMAMAPAYGGYGPP